jgi:hypothetical protein
LDGNADTNMTPRRNEMPRRSRRLFDRAQFDGTFSIAHGDHLRILSIKDVSVGGMRLAGIASDLAVDDVLSGQLAVIRGGMTLEAQVSCKVVAIDSDGHARVRFLELPEDFVEFLRASVLRTLPPSAQATRWLPGSAELLAPDAAPRSLPRRVLRGVFRLELLAAVLVLGLAVVILLRASVDQSFWVVQSHEVLAPVDAEVVYLNTDYPIDVGDTVVRLGLSTVTGREAEISIEAPVAAQYATWRFNVGDTLRGGDIVGLMHNAPLSHDNVQVLVGARNPLMTIGYGDRLVFRTAQDQRIEGTVTRTIAASQAAMVTGLVSSSLVFDFYHVAEVPVSPLLTLETDLRLDHVASLFLRLQGALGLTQ